jgi:hypothetical protein
MLAKVLLVLVAELIQMPGIDVKPEKESEPAPDPVA